LLKVLKGAEHSYSKVQCDALMLDDQSRSDAYPTVQVHEPSADVGHEATVNALSQEQLWYMMSRGLSASQARALLVNGFIDAFVKELPMEYAIEINRMIAHEMEGSIG
jgi:Fe-S cluster assembly protein SufB